LEAKVLEMAASQGFFAVLFVGLLFYVLRENSKREAQYQKTINTLAQKLDIADDIKKDVSEIKVHVERRGRGE